MTLDLLRDQESRKIAPSTVSVSVPTNRILTQLKEQNLNSNARLQTHSRLIRCTYLSASFTDKTSFPMPRLWTEQHLSFTLPSQQKVNLIGFHLRSTYDGVLEMTLDERVNRMVLDYLEVPSHWRNSAIYMEMPKDLSEILPAIVCFAELESHEGNFSPDHYSQLNYIWLIDSLEEIPLRQLIQSALDRLDWEGNAREVEYNP